MAYGMVPTGVCHQGCKLGHMMQQADAMFQLRLGHIPHQWLQCTKTPMAVNDNNYQLDTCLLLVLFVLLPSFAISF